MSDDRVCGVSSRGFNEPQRRLTDADNSLAQRPKLRLPHACDRGTRLERQRKQRARAGGGQVSLQLIKERRQPTQRAAQAGRRGHHVHHRCGGGGGRHARRRHGGYFISVGVTGALLECAADAAV
jgi:hypothetical protein